MYTNEEGRRQLERFIQQYQTIQGDTAVRKVLYLDISVSTPGILAPSEEDVSVINSIVPFFDILDVRDRGFILRWYAIKSVSYLDSTEEAARDAHCVDISVQLGLSFLVALSMSTFSFSEWRSVGIPGTMFNGLSLINNHRRDFMIETVPLTIENPTLARMHIGHIAAALQMQNEITNWHEKFTLCYEKAQILFSAPSHLKLNFCNEAYLNYFRCLEYLIMDRILQEKGNYSNHKLVQAFQKYKVQVGQASDKKRLLQVANKLDRQRDSAAAHLTRSNLNEPSLTGQQVYELKTIIDALSFKHTNFNLYGLSEKGVFPIHLPLG